MKTLLKKLLIVFMVVTFVLLNLGAINVFTRTIDNRKTYKNAYQWTGKPKDLLLQWAKEVEDRIDGTTGNQSFLFSEETVDPTGTEGRLYYNTSTNTLKLHTGSSYVNVSTASGNSLEGSYDAGSTITVDADAITLTTGTSDNNVVLAIVQNESSNDNSALTITFGSGATGTGLLIDSQSSGTDIAGDNWNVNQAGALTIVGITNTGAFTQTTSDFTFNDTYDIHWDSSEDTLGWLDNAIQGFGNTAATPDVKIRWDTSNLLIESAAEDTGQIHYGATSAIDVVHFANDNTLSATFNAATATLELNGYDLQLQDGDFLMFGDDDDFTIDSTTTKILDITPSGNTDDFAVIFGIDQSGMDIKAFGATTSTYMEWNAGNDELFLALADLKMSQGSQIEFVDVSDGNTDWTIDLSTDELLLFLPSETDDTSKFNIGDATNTADVRIFGAGASTIVFEAADDLVTFNAYDMRFNDGDLLIFGDANDWTFDSSTTKILDIIPSTTDETSAVYIGADTAGADLVVFGATTSKRIIFDASKDSFETDCAFDIGVEATFTDSDTTPDVSGGSYFITNATGVTITDFDGTNIAAGQIIVVESAGAIVYDVDGDPGNLKGGSTNITTADGDLTVWFFNGTDWLLISFMDLSDDMS